MEKVQKSQISNKTKLSIVVIVCIVAMIGLILGVIFSTKVSIFRTQSDVYTLKGDYKLTQEDIDAIGLGENGLGLTHACCIDLKGHTLDLNGYDFSVISNDSGKMITFKNGKIKGKGSLTVKGTDCDVNFDNIKLNCDYNINATNSKLFLTKTDADTSKFSAVGGALILNGSNISGALDLKSDLEAYNSTLVSVTATNVTASVKGEVNCVLSAGLDAQIKIYAKVEDVEAGQGSKVTIAKEEGGNEYKGGNINVLNAKGGKVIVDNCANVNEFNVVTDSVVEIGGTTTNLNIDSDSNITVNKCAIIGEVNVNTITTLVYAGTASCINLNKDNAVEFKATAYIKQLLVSEAAANSEISFNGRAGYISLGSENVKFEAMRDARIALIQAPVDTYFTGEGFSTSTYSVIDEKVVSNDEEKINVAKNSFVMPIYYINSDCKGDGFIKFSAGGNKADQNPTIEYLAQIGHEYEYSVIMRSTEDEHGIGRYTCKDCGEFYDVELPLRRVVLDAPTLFDLFGLDVKDGTYTYGLDNELFMFNINQFEKEASSAAAGEEYDVVVIDKAFIHATVENNRDNFNVKVFGYAEFKYAVYSHVSNSKFEIINKVVSEAKTAGAESIIAVLDENDETKGIEKRLYNDIKAYMEGSEIYFMLGDADEYTLGLYDTINSYLQMGLNYATSYIGELIGEGIELTETLTIEDVVNGINVLLKAEVLTERYEPALTLLFNVLGNETILRNLLPTFDIVTEKDGEYSVSMDKLLEVLTLFGNQSLAEYIDSVFGRGTVSAVLELIKEVYDLTIGEIYDYIVMLASNLEKDEVDVLEDLDVIISILVDDVNDMVSETDKEKILSVLDKFFKDDDSYSFANCVNNYENLTIYQIMYGEDDGQSGYSEKKAEAQEEIDSFVNSVEGFLYAISLDNAFGKLITPFIPYYEMISETISGEITWSYNANDELAQYSVVFDKKPAASSDAEGQEENLNLFTFAYDAENNEITKIFADIEAGPVCIKADDTKEKCYCDIAFLGYFEFELDIDKNETSESTLDFSLDNFPTIIDMFQYVLDKCSTLYIGLDLPVLNEISLDIVKGEFTKVDTTKVTAPVASTVYFTRNVDDGIYELFEGEEFAAETDYFVIDSTKNIYSILFSMSEVYTELFLDFSNAKNDKMSIIVDFNLNEFIINVDDTYIKDGDKNIGQKFYVYWDMPSAEPTKFVTIIDGAIIYNAPVISIKGAFSEYSGCESSTGKTIEQILEANKNKLANSEGIELTVDTDNIDIEFSIIYGEKTPFITAFARKHEISFIQYNSAGTEVKVQADIKYDPTAKEFTVSYKEGTDCYSGSISIAEAEDSTIYNISIGSDAYNFIRSLLKSISLPLPITGDNKTVDLQVTTFFENKDDANVFCGIDAKALFSEDSVAGFTLMNTEKDGFLFEAGKFVAKDGYVLKDGENVFNMYEIDPIVAVELSENNAKLFVNYPPMVKITIVLNEDGFNGFDVQVLDYKVRILVDTTNNLCDIYFDLPFMKEVGLLLEDSNEVKTLTTILAGQEYSYTLTEIAENTFLISNDNEKYNLIFKALYDENDSMTGISIKVMSYDNTELLYEGTIQSIEEDNGSKLSIVFKALETQIEGVLYYNYSDKEGDSVKSVGESKDFEGRDAWEKFGKK